LAISLIVMTLLAVTSSARPTGLIRPLSVCILSTPTAPPSRSLSLPLHCARHAKAKMVRRNRHEH
jgi:hypothetical protein